jgi:undecaprenyl phosphate-alpha-L-ara4FN deformylase
MNRLVLKVDVDTLKGTLEGVPRLIALFQKHQVGATFLFSLGPDHTGRAIKRAFRPGFFQKVRRTNVTSHYGYKTLMYGTLLPGPDIGKLGQAQLRAARDAGFECGIHCWDHVTWQDGVMQADGAWTRLHMTRAIERFQEVFQYAPQVHGAAGWQMNVHALRLTQQLGFAYCSDGRGTHPFRPMVKAEPIDTPQFPTTLPTLDELIGTPRVTERNVAESILSMTQDQRRDHVYTLHAELEGLKLLDVMEQLIVGWKQQGYALTDLGSVARFTEHAALPRCAVNWEEIPGRSGTLLNQGAQFA